MNNTPAEAREIVAQALESGEYIQGVGCLEDSGKRTHCCLGVAIREFMKCEQHSITTENTARGVIIFDGDYVSLPPEVQSWLGFRTQFGAHEGSDFRWASLMTVNDTGTSFPEIAKLFRNPPEGLLAQ